MGSAECRSTCIVCLYYFLFEMDHMLFLKMINTSHCMNREYSHWGCKRGQKDLKFSKEIKDVIRFGTQSLGYCMWHMWFIRPYFVLVTCTLWPGLLSLNPDIIISGLLPKLQGSPACKAPGHFFSFSKRIDKSNPNSRASFLIGFDFSFLCWA